MHNGVMYDSDHDPIPTSDFHGQKPQLDIPFTSRRRINWGDSDTAEIAYTGSFIPMAIDALEVWYEAVLGHTFYDLKRNNMGNPAVSLHFDFHAPIVVGERLDIAVFVDKLGTSSITHRFEMTKVGGPLVATASFTSVLVTDVHTDRIKSKVFPADWRARIEGYMRECEMRDQGVAGRREIMDFWFGPPGSPDRGQPREVWFARQDAGASEFDAEIRARFEPTIQAAAAGDLDHWAHCLDGALALCLLLDQFTRNIYRGTAQAFATDRKILEVSKRAVAAGWLEGLDIQPKKFLIMPFQHTEDLASQEQGVDLFAAMRGSESGDKSYNAMIRHRDLIATYGRFPHRNKALGRINTPEEETYLKDPKAGF
jgi:uncharacterized protein (DUF924 family)/acyl-CoA thioesterase FadM